MFEKKELNKLLIDLTKKIDGVHKLKRKRKNYYRRFWFTIHKIDSKKDQRVWGLSEILNLKDFKKFKIFKLY